LFEQFSSKIGTLLQALKNNLSSENKRNKKNIKISIFLFVENSLYGRIIIEMNALPHAK
jgi:hypothetical protein